VSMAERQRALAEEILHDPAVESLSSFIGIDGTNTTVNSGRIQINLKPLEERKTFAGDIIRRLQPNLAKIPASPCSCSPSRTCPSRTGSAAPSISTAWSIPTPRNWPSGCRASWDKLKSLPMLSRRGQ